ncbi:serine/threonine-protein kinase HAL4/sat4 [Dissophora globulifera]|nr:serine/threonine-protein kinase HAL4/sat4 [Dissophora globulifera]
MQSESQVFKRQGTPTMRIDTSYGAMRHGTSASCAAQTRPQEQSPSLSQSLQQQQQQEQQIDQHHSGSHHHPKAWMVNHVLLTTPVKDHASSGCSSIEHRGDSNDDIKRQNHRNSDQHGPDSRIDDTVGSLGVHDAVWSSLVDPALTALRPPTPSSLVRSATVISATSSSGRLRVTHRLSYLAHVEDVVEVQEPYLAATATAGLSSLIVKVPQATIVNSSPLSVKTPTVSAKPMTQQSPFTTNSAATVSESLSQRSSFPLGPRGVAVPAPTPPPILNLYKRLLRVFKPPTETSDSDSSGPNVEESTLPVADVAPHSRGPFGLPASPENSRKGSLKDLSPKLESAAERVSRNPSPPPILSPPRDSASPIHRPPGSGSFRARFLKKLRSSPNFNTEVHPLGVTTISKETSAIGQPCYRRAHCNQEHPEEEISSPYSPLLSDFEHEQTCPAGQRMQERMNGGGPPRASTMPKSTRSARMPTLQSKYGVPGRELGAGTQAQVMLLRVKSSKRIRNAHLSSEKKKKATSTSDSTTNARMTLSPPEDLDHTNESLLTPRLRSGTLMTTTEDEVTPEQREAYRKRLLRRTSTAGLSVNSQGGLIYAIKKFRPPKASETHRQYLKKVCAEFCISTSMDHENIIRTIDLVRDQPGQEVDNDYWPHEQYQERQPQDFNNRRDSNGNYFSFDQRQKHLDYTTTPAEDEGNRDDCQDCNCPREHRRRARDMKSGDELHSPTSPTSPKHHRSISRRSVISRPQRRRSVDTLSLRKSVVGSLELPSSPKLQEYHRHEPRSGTTTASAAVHPARFPHRVTPAPQEAPITAAARKRKQRKQDQELRQKEVQGLKQQKELKKQSAKQLRLDQFPEYCMVMEYAPGGDLFNLLTKSYPPISLHEKHCLWRQLVNGVQYIHSMGVAHRDLKPENILIDATGRILKITDFGIANVFKSVGDPSPLPCRGIIGSEPYIAPEEFYQEEYDPRAVDVWACGIIFYVMYYAAMPWARADRKKDARFARFISDIMVHRHDEPHRRLQFDRRQIHSKEHFTAGFGSRPVGAARGGSGYSPHGSGSVSTKSDAFSRPHEAIHHRQFPPYQPGGYTSGSISSGSTASSQAVSPTTLRNSKKKQEGEDSTITVSPGSSISGSPVSPRKYAAMEKSNVLAKGPAGLASTRTTTIYNTFAYNGYIGGHEFIDRIETPGCRRVLYAILEPDARKRLTIDQVVNDDWVSQIRHCTDCPEKQEQQAAMIFGSAAAHYRYMQMHNGELHHRHETPKKVKA